MTTFTVNEEVLTANITEEVLQVEIAEGYTFYSTGRLYTWSYADETERLAATGFTSSDLGYVAIQTDDDSLWMLSGYNPISWKSIGDMQKSVYDVDSDDIVDEAESIDGGTY